MQLSIVVGNPNARSRTLTVAEAVAERVSRATGAEIAPTIDLCDHAKDIFRWPDETMAQLSEVVAACDFVVFASPTYKGAYTGLLKGFLDRYPSNGLAGVTAFPVMTGGSEEHAMAPDTSLRPLLVELGASVPTQAVFIVTSQMGDLDTVIDEWAAQNLSVPAVFR